MISLPHLRGNPLAAVDIETTGDEGGFHEICQIAIVPLNHNLEPCYSDDIKPFYIEKIAPLYPERCKLAAMRVHGMSIDELLMEGVSQATALNLLLDWFDKLRLPHLKRLTPIAHNWGTEKSFLTPWMGPDLMNTIFHPHPRDTMQYCNFINDFSAMSGGDKIFTGLGLSKVCRTLHISNEHEHNALSDAIATGHFYRAILTQVI